MPARRLDAIHGEMMPGPAGKDFKKGALRSAISFAKGVASVNLVDVFRGSLAEHGRVGRKQLVVCTHGIHAAIKLASKEAYRSENALASGKFNCPDVAGPRVDVLKDMTMQRAIAFGSQFYVWKRLPQTLQGEFYFG